MNDSERAGQAAPLVPVEDLSYTAASRELEAIVAFFEQRDVDVDQLVTRLERATAIVDELDRRIRRTRGQVEELVPRLEAAASAASVTDSPGVRGTAPTEDDGADEEEDVADDEEDDEDHEFLDGSVADDSDADQPLF